MCCGTLYLRLIDSCITQLEVQGLSRTCDESKEEEEEEEAAAEMVEAMAFLKDAVLLLLLYSR